MLPVPDYVAELDKPVRGLKLGVAKEYFGEGLDDEVRQAVETGIDKLKQLGLRDRSGIAAAHAVCDSNVLPDRDRGSFVEPGAL